jgi:hypothetical protein
MPTQVEGEPITRLTLRVNEQDRAGAETLGGWPIRGRDPHPGVRAPGRPVADAERHSEDRSILWGAGWREMVFRQTEARERRPGEIPAKVFAAYPGREEPGESPEKRRY